MHHKLKAKKPFRLRWFDNVGCQTFCAQRKKEPCKAQGSEAREVSGNALAATRQTPRYARSSEHCLRSSGASQPVW